MSHPFGNDQWATGLITLSAEGECLVWKYRFASCNTSQFTYLSQVGKSWPPSLVHLSWMPAGHPPSLGQRLSSSVVLMRMGTDAGLQFLPRGPGWGMGNGEGQTNTASSYWELTTPSSILILANEEYKVSQFSHMEFKEDASVTFYTCGPNGTLPWSLALGGWIAGKAYLAGCSAGLNYHGMCWNSLDVEIISRNSHFLFHKSDISL